MSEPKPNRSAWLKLRVTPAEKETIAAKAAAQGQTVTDFIRQRALDYRLRQTPLEREHVRQLARIGANLNQLARWANTFKNRAEVVQVLAALWSMEQSLQNADTPRPQEANSRGEPPCT
ncbi:plasmid mobilization protein [Desulfovibrio cuneatus]|uniref:plasmid mobilization protein n=1 Tax=Desulfovibrio cuneatus TaxID=159728 RepID=UPI00048417E9|nr:plasmid mobilization relaxosome protein MobC [Desulfovibrio cuneatus]